MRGAPARASPPAMGIGRSPTRRSAGTTRPLGRRSTVAARSSPTPPVAPPSPRHGSSTPSPATRRAPRVKVATSTCRAAALWTSVRASLPVVWRGAEQRSVCSGSLDSLGYNLIDDASCGTPATGDIIGQSPQLGTLANNGGPTFTQLPAVHQPRRERRAGGRHLGHGSRRRPARRRPRTGPERLLHHRLGRSRTGHAAATDDHDNHHNDAASGRPRTATGWSAPTAASSISGPPSSTARPAVSPCSARSSASARRPTRPATGSSPPTAASSPSGTPATTDRSPASAWRQRRPASRTVSTPRSSASCRPHDGGGYFMVASDGGVFAFGDAHFAGSCPGVGGCAGAAVAVVPDASGNGYWLITQTGNVYAFGDAPYYGGPGNQGFPVTSAVRTGDGAGYYVLLAERCGLRLWGRGGTRRPRGVARGLERGLCHLLRR